MNFFDRITSKLAEGVDPLSSSGGQSAPEDADETSSPIDEHQVDADLVTRAQAGDYRAFDDLVTRHRGKIFAMIQNMVKNEADAWDLSQVAFVKAWKALPRFESRARFSTWLFRISHNVVYDWLRKKKKENAGELDDSLLGTESIASGSRTTPQQDARPDEALGNKELRAKIKDALMKLSEDHRQVVVLREIQGMDYKEIADIIGCELGTVMSRLFYARKKLQTLLSDER